MTARHTVGRRRRPLTLRLLVLAATLLITMSTIVVGASRSTAELSAPQRLDPPQFSTAHHKAAERMVAARKELATARAIVRDTPALADSMRDRITLLRLVTTYQVPAGALDSS